MITQWILQTLAGLIVGLVIFDYIQRIYTKLRIFLFRKSSKFIAAEKEIENFQVNQFYNTFGFNYEDLIKYAPELDEFLSSKLEPELKDSVRFKRRKMQEFYDSINVVEQVDIIKFKQTIENIKSQKALENID